VLTASGDDLTETDDPFKVAMRQIAGVFAQLEKARLVGKLDLLCNFLHSVKPWSVSYRCFVWPFFHCVKPSGQWANTRARDRVRFPVRPPNPRCSLNRACVLYLKGISTGDLLGKGHRVIGRTEAECHAKQRAMIESGQAEETDRFVFRILVGPPACQ
jgi:hypothetical protein